MANESSPHPHPYAADSNRPGVPTPRAVKGALLGLVFLTGLNLFNYLDRYVLTAVLPKIQDDLNLSNTLIGWLPSAFMVGYFLTAPFFGYLGDRSPRKWLIAFGIFFWSVGTILSGFCHTYTTLVACRLLVGLGEASYATLAPSWLSDLFPPSRRNNALTIFYVALPVGSALGFIAGGLAIKHGTWRDGFLWAGAPGLLLALLLLTLREPARGEADGLESGGTEGEPSAGKPQLRDVFRLLTIPNYVLITLGYTAYTFALGAFPAWTAKFLHGTHGMEVHAADTDFGYILVGTGLVSTLVGGAIGTRWRRRYPGAYSLVLTLSAVLAVPVAFAAFLVGSTTGAMLCLTAAMFFLFLPTGPLSTLTLESVPVELRGSAMAVSIFVIHILGDFWSPGIVGWLADHLAPATDPAGLRKALLILPTMLVVCAGFWAWLAWRQRRESESVGAGPGALPQA